MEAGRQQSVCQVKRGGGNARSERGAKMMRGSGVDLHVGGHGQIWMDR